MKFPVFLANVQTLIGELAGGQTEFSDIVGVTQSTVSRWGNSIPRGHTLAKMASLAKVDPDDFVHTPLAQARKAKRAELPSGQKLVEVMETLLDTAGLGHLADEYAPKLARLLPGLLADSPAPLVDQAFGQGKLPGGHVPDRAKGGRAQRR